MLTPGFAYICRTFPDISKPAGVRFNFVARCVRLTPAPAPVAGCRRLATTTTTPMYMNVKVHGHASPIKMYATQMCNGCTIYKMQIEWCIRHSSVRSPARNGRYRAPAPCAFTKQFDFCADGRPAAPRDPRVGEQ
ncbi:hypothetical protein EVAR_27661_1 [Eumeta japonica]|uniref:Uncharacterized protein n=1 Tax=Eumeta variegata TaxID=151549 RepID=A0A4C1V1S3_EUMVA|nr:hypothetical protein EVAR_27661_1 [Eumeta japonica]